MNNRRALLSLLVFPFARAAKTAVYGSCFRTVDGTLVYDGFSNGYKLFWALKVKEDNISVATFQYSLVARRNTSVENLLRAAGAKIVLRSDFSSLPTQPLLTQIDDIKGDFNVLIDDRLFLNDNVGTKQVNADQKVSIFLAGNGSLVAK